MSGPLVSISFDFPEGEVQVHHEVHVNGTIPFNPNDIHPTAATSNTSFEYSGRHDQGTLPQLQSTGHMAHLIAAILDVKAQSDNYLTAKIGQQTNNTGAKAIDETEDIMEGEAEADNNEVHDDAGDPHAKSEPAAKKQKVSKSSKSNS